MSNDLGKKTEKAILPNNFSVVGIGASAGGLEAYIELFSKMPTDTGIAFVLVQHLDPSHPSLSVNIIAKNTKLKVQEVEDQMLIEPNQIYMIPPNTCMQIENDRLILFPRSAAPGPQMAVDFFFESLAKEKGSQAIGVLLSGTGGDGTNGLSAIKEAGGITFAQDPQQAKFKEMPEHAIAAGVVDLILSVEEIAQKIAGLVMEPREVLNLGLEKIFNLLKVHSKVDFSHYKYPTVERRIRRRMMVQKSTGIAAYVDYLVHHPEEITALYNDILINVTAFFRDPESYEILSNNVFPQFIIDRPEKNSIRVWVAGCSSGEEAYSIAITLFEFLGEEKAKTPIQIFATDISVQAIKKARLAIYPKSIEQNVSSERLQNFFDKVGDGYKVKKMIRDVCYFSIHDMTRDPPFAKLDLISCRNVLIYFDADLQKKVIPIFHYALKPNGYLWLGKSESTGGFVKLFTLEDQQHKFYSKANVQTPLNFHFPLGTASPPLLSNLEEKVPRVIDGLSLKKDVEKIILSKFSPPSVIVNYQMEVLQFRGQCAPYLELALSNNLLKMARPELLASLRTLMQMVKRENKSVRKEQLRLELNSNPLIVTIEILPVNPLVPLKDRLFLVFFEKVAELKTILNKKNSSTGQQINEILKELAEAKESEQTIVEQYEAAQEELTAANEELQSTNEELQSTNEEMETAKEELQATNDELQIRNADLKLLGNDLNNLLTATEIPILMISNDKRIRRFTPEAESAFNIITSDIGRPISDIKSNFGLDMNALIDDVTQNVKSKEIEVQDLKGIWKRLQIRPYRTLDNKIDGAIIALDDIDVLKKREQSSSDAFEYVKSVADTVPLPVAVVDFDLKIRSANHAFYTYFLVTDNLSGNNFFTTLEMKGEYLPTLHHLFSLLVESNKPIKDFEIDETFPRIGKRKILLSGGKIYATGDGPPSVLLSFVDITERRRIEDERNVLLVQAQVARAEAESANRAKDIFLATLSHELRTPLSAILPWAQLIQFGKIDGEKVKYGASIIEQSAKAQSQLIDDLLDISRMIAGKLATEIKEINLVTVILMAVDSMRAIAEKKSIKIEMNLEPGSEMILGDPMRLQQIIWNLLTNAVKFSPKESQIDVRLQYVGSEAKRFARVTVQDYGNGIPVDFLPHVFDRFSQADSASTRTYGGLGLGLSIVQKLVELQGGVVRAENSSDGKGAIFTVEFPLISKTSGIVPTDFLRPNSNQDSQAADQPRLDGLRILCVDDDESAREAVNIYLKSFGAEVMSVESASEAMKSLKAFKPDIIVSDIAMPVDDGYSLIQKIRGLAPEHGGQIPAIALTAFTTLDDSTKILAAGFQAHVAKPVEANELGRVILKFAKKSVPS